MAKTKFGYMPCPDCASRVVVKINERETLSYSCDECDGIGYSKKGEGRYPAWLKKIERVKPGVPEVGSAGPVERAKPKPAPAAPAAVEVPKKSGLLMG